MWVDIFICVSQQDGSKITKACQNLAPLPDSGRNSLAELDNSFGILGESFSLVTHTIAALDECLKLIFMMNVFISLDNQQNNRSRTEFHSGNSPTVASFTLFQKTD